METFLRKVMRLVSLLATFNSTLYAVALKPVQERGGGVERVGFVDARGARDVPKDCLKPYDEIEPLG